MTKAVSLLATTNVPPFTFDLLVDVMWPAMIAGVTATVLAVVLLSMDQLTDVEKTPMQRLRTSPMSSLFLWSFIGLGVGLSSFGIAFVAQLVTIYSSLSLFEAIIATIVVPMAFGILVTLAIVGRELFGWNARHPRVRR